MYHKHEREKKKKATLACIARSSIDTEKKKYCLRTTTIIKRKDKVLNNTRWHPLVCKLYEVKYKFIKFKKLNRKKKINIKEPNINYLKS